MFSGSLELLFREIKTAATKGKVFKVNHVEQLSFLKQSPHLGKDARGICHTGLGAQLSAYAFSSGAVLRSYDLNHEKSPSAAMSARPLISYDDIILPYEQPRGPSANESYPPPAKKRKKNNRKAKHAQTVPSSNAKNVSFSAESSYAGSTNTSTSMYEQGEDVHIADEGEYEEESRELTHEEIWDDSALVDAWEAAMEEYRLYHGSEDDWKKEPVKKSPLWYNIPVDTSRKKADATSSSNLPVFHDDSIMAAADEEVEGDSKPIDFNTFEPTHDPSLPTPPTLTENYSTENFGKTIVSQDEAFSRAMNAMYWSGYWTAIYHCQRQKEKREPDSTEIDAVDESGDEDIDGEEEGVRDGSFVSTQR
ncbi:hypothetical protein NLJ89_g7604 [Agrocybe chaxingu]|uniref:Survival Motor Neuron Gemin2-binding domain-containing protein n=1 Tax=Agrocybe chaxingu TaxID=84603 RepID=A0A9W8JYV4_9AGAR|nr:hypothetical protein NLJ89_g7604 [Agrocybe chaxingu]